MSDATADLLRAAEGLIVTLGAFPPDRACRDSLDRLKRAVLAVSPRSEAVFHNPPALPGPTAGGVTAEQIEEARSGRR